MKKENKKVLRILGVSALVIAGITCIYQFEYNKMKTNTKVKVVVATKDIKTDTPISKGNTTVELREKSSLPEDYIQDQDLIVGSIAVENIYGNEILNESRIISKEDYEEKDYRLVSIAGKDNNVDTFCGYSIKPYDKVDLLYFENNGEYEGEIYLEDQVVYDLKNSSGISYSDRGDNWVPTYALIWVKKDIAEEINQRQSSGGYFKLQLHRYRATN